MKQRILIVGGGFAGVWSALSATRLLDQHGRTDISVTLLAPQPELRIRPRFYEPNVQSMKAPLTELLAAVGVEFVQGTAEGIQKDIQSLIDEMQKSIDEANAFINQMGAEEE